MCTPYRSPVLLAPRQLDRRAFLRAGVAASGALAATTLLSDPARAAQELGCVPKDRISIQLYTLRDVMAEDLDGTLAALAALGYRRVEHAGFTGTANGTAAEFKEALDAHGLHATSGHTSVPYPFDAAAWEQIVEDALLLGQDYIVEPLPQFALAALGAAEAERQAGSPVLIGTVPSLVWADYAATLNQAAEVAAEAGIRVGYHNHNGEFARTPDNPLMTGYDVLMAETNPELVHFEMDLYWVVAGLHDPVEVLGTYGDRVRQFHVKDMNEAGEITAPGTGTIDFDRIFEAAHDLGIEEFTIEQDNAGQDAVESARLGYELLDATCAASAAGAPKPAGDADDERPDLAATGGGLGVAALGVTAIAAALRLRNRGR